MTVASLIRRFGGTVTIKQKGSGTTDAIGGKIDSATGLVTTGFVQILSGTDPVVGGREIGQRTGTLYLKGKVDIDFADRVVFDGATFEVRAVRQPDNRRTGDAMLYTIADVEEVI